MWQLRLMLENMGAVDRALLKAEACGGDLRTGTASPDPMQRALQKIIDNLNQKLGRKADKADA